MDKKKKSNRSKYRAITALVCAVWGLLSVNLALAATSSADIPDFSYQETALKASYTATTSTDYTGELKDVAFAGSEGAIEITVSDQEKTGSTGGCDSKNTYAYYRATATLTIKNASTTDALVLEYVINEMDGNQGECTESGIGNTKSVTLAPNGTHSIGFTSGLRYDSDEGTAQTDQVANVAPAKYSVEIKSAEPVKNDIKVTLSSVSAIEEAVPGSYTASADGTSCTVGETYDATISTVFTLEAATAEGYLFDGWYVNGSRVSAENPFTTNFYEENTVITARFNVSDPLAQIAVLNAEDSEGDAVDAALTKYDYLSFDSAGAHGTQHSYHTTYGTKGTNNDYGDPAYFEDLVWSMNDAAIRSLTAGMATGDTQTSMGYSNAQAFMYSDVLSVQAKKDCQVSFDCDLSASGSSFKTAYLCYLVSSNAVPPTIKVSATDENFTATKLNNTSVTVVTGGSNKASDHISTTVPLSKGQYLHIYALGYSVKHELKFSSGHSENSYSYSASISNFKITALNTRYEVGTSFADNTSIVLGSGKVTVNGTDYTVGSNGKTTANFSAVAGTPVTMSIKQAPSGYMFFGWEDNGERIYSPTYSYTLNEARDVKALFVPAVTITMGSSGYHDATYAYKNLSGKTVAVDGQYVARNAGYTAFYTNLEDAFAAESTVVLLAGDTLKGDFEIPAGKNLVVPYGMSDAGSITPMQLTASAGMKEYCSVTLDGELTVNGTLVVSAQQNGYSYGCPGGPIGILKLSDSADITVNGTLCAFGLISGNGVITANSGATVYEFMEVRDMRSILVVYEIYKEQDKNAVFPFNSFFIKNIEASVTYQHGSALKALFSLKLAGNDVPSTGEIPLIGSSGAMFNLSSEPGSLTKLYRRDTDQTVYRVDESSEAHTGTFTISMSYSASGMAPVDVTLNTANYYLPLCAGYGIEVAGKLTLNDKFKLLPGASLDITEIGEMTVAEDAELVLYRLNDYDLRSGGSGTTYQGYSAGGYPVNSSTYPTSTYSRRNKATIGSAKINVNGVLNVQGGLYVTHDATELTTYSNGYNDLTGTGTIVFDEAYTSLTKIYEAMACSGSNAPQMDAVSLTAIKGITDLTLTQNDGQTGYTAFEKDTYYGVQKSDFYVWCTNRMRFFDSDTDGNEVLQYVAASSGASTQVSAGLISDGCGTVVTQLNDPSNADRSAMGWKNSDSGDIETASEIQQAYFSDYADDAEFYAAYAVAQIDANSYETLAAAIEAYEDGYIQMLESVCENLVLAKDATIDTNGKTVVIVAETGSSGRICGADVNTNGYGVGADLQSAGTLTIEGTGITVAPVAYVNDRNYVRNTVSNSDTSATYSFHRFEITPIGYQFYYNPNGTHPSHLAFQAVIHGDDTARGLLKDIGFRIDASAVSAEGKPADTENWYLIDMNANKTENEEPIILSKPANEELITFVAVEFEDAENFDVIYTVTAKADFDGSYQDAVILSDQPNEGNTHQISFDATLNEYYDYLLEQETLTETEETAKKVLSEYLGLK